MLYAAKLEELYATYATLYQIVYYMEPYTIPLSLYYYHMLYAAKPEELYATYATL